MKPRPLSVLTCDMFVEGRLPRQALGLLDLLTGQGERPLAWA